MWEEVTPEREKEIIEKIARAIVEYDMEVPALLVLSGIKPLSYVSSNFARMLFGAYLPVSSGDYLSVFEKSANFEKIMKRVEELREEKKKEKEKEKSKKLGIMEKLKRSLGKKKRKNAHE